jgi:hypothetical protein
MEQVLLEIQGLLDILKLVLVQVVVGVKTQLELGMQVV